MFLLFRRALAKILDLSIVYLMVKPFFASYGIGFDLLIYLASGALFDALCVYLFSTTPGKLLLQLKVDCLSQVPFKYYLLRAIFSYAKIVGCAFFIYPPSILAQNEPHYEVPEELPVVSHASYRKVVLGWAIALTYIGISIPDTYYTETSFSQESHTDFSQWKSLVSKDAGFKVLLPQIATKGSESIKIPTVKSAIDCQTYKSEGLSVTYLDLPSKITKWSPNLVLKSSVSIIAKNKPLSKILEKKLIKSMEYPTIDYSLASPDKTTYGRLILVGNRLYKLEGSADITEGETLDLESYQQFIHSFQILS